MEVKLISHTVPFFDTIAQAASVCYNSKPSLKIVKGCIKSGHHSVLEHGSFTFKISGISRAASHQLVRHRIASYSQRSQRYCIEDNIDYVAPVQENDLYMWAYKQATEHYNELLEKGVSAEDARLVLPNGCPTTIFVTMNLRALSHFMNERLCQRAQGEIRQMANKMKKEIMESPDFTDEEKELFSILLVPKCEQYSELNFCPEHSGCGRHPSIKDIAKQLK